MANDDYGEYKKWEKKKGSLLSKLSKQINAWHVIGICILFVVGQQWTSTGRIPTNVFFGSIIAFAIVLIFLTFRETNEQKLIPEHIIKQIAWEALEKKRQKGIEIPFDAKIRVMLSGEGVYEQDMISRTSGLIKRDVGFEIIRKGYVKTGVMAIHPYNGTVLGIRWERLGYTGRESKDRQIVPVGVLKPVGGNI